VGSRPVPPSSKRTTVRGRTADRGAYDRSTINAILDEGVVCHVGFVEDGEPFVIPMSYARVDDTLYFHGALAGRAMGALGSRGTVCVEVTIVDGLKFGRPPISHGINYRSVVVFGPGREVTDRAEKMAALKAIMEHLMPGRWADIRQTTDGEVAATAVAAVSIAEASAKTSSGPPAEDDEETSRCVWAGTLPLRLSALKPVPAPDQDPKVPAPEYLKDYGRGGTSG